jgi:hypothetical protein
MRRTTCVAVCVLGAGIVGAVAEARAKWTAERIAVVEGFQTPESVAVDPHSGAAYVSNVVTADAPGKGPWDEDGEGFISRLKPGGELDVLKWRGKIRERGPKIGTLNAPKGICILPGQLRVADITRMVYFDTNRDRPGIVTRVRGARRLNDMATDGKAVYLSDTEAGRVHRLAPGEHLLIQAPEGVNGITVHEAKLYAVSWSEHDVYQLDPSGRSAPEPFGLASHFTALDGIEFLDDQTILVSDFSGNKVSAIGLPDKTVTTLLETTTPADIGLDRERMLLYVPLFTANRVEVYRLENK